MAAFYFYMLCIPAVFCVAAIIADLWEYLTRP